MKKLLLSLLIATMGLILNAQCETPVNLGYTCEEDVPNYNYKYKVVLQWDAVPNTKCYDIYVNGSLFGACNLNFYIAGSNAPGEFYYQVLSVCYDNSESELSEKCYVTIGPDAVDENEKKFEIYPNPVENQLIIEADEKVRFVEIYNVSGLKVMEADVNDNVLNVSELISGMYFIRFTTEKGEAVRRFIKK